jgi:acyl carrier protein
VAYRLVREQGKDWQRSDRQPGALTSMEVVEFVTEIEQRFNMQFSDRDLQDPRFVTIAGVAELILERTAETSESR